LICSYIVPGSDAATKDSVVLFYGINGTQLTVSNYQSLLANDSFTLNLADYNAATPNNKTVALTKTVLAENPI
jgi:hypothetical protein